METVRNRIEFILNSSPYLQIALERGLINLSSLARELVPQIEKDLRKAVSVPAVSMALKRVVEDLERSATANPTQRFGVPVMRGPVTLFEVKNSPTLLPAINEVLNRMRSDRSSLLLIERGPSGTSIAIEATMQATVEAWLANEKVTQLRGELSAIAVPLTADQSFRGLTSLHIPLQLLTWRGVRVVQAHSSSHELTLLIQTPDAEGAMSVLGELESEI